MRCKIASILIRPPRSLPCDSETRGPNGKILENAFRPILHGLCVLSTCMHLVWAYPVRQDALQHSPHHHLDPCCASIRSVLFVGIHTKMSVPANHSFRAQIGHARQIAS
jgi:hypothetical protein